MSQTEAVATDELLLLLTGVAPFLDKADSKHWLPDR
ncbi:hypothetical protein A2U01_0057543, partial [Trifolium medium]|nr:hypothetical protein [Trifolium medium]